MRHSFNVASAIPNILAASAVVNWDTLFLPSNLGGKRNRSPFASFGFALAFSFPAGSEHQERKHIHLLASLPIDGSV
jgi:hypothetical protein